MIIGGIPMNLFKNLMQVFQVKRNGVVISNECYATHGKNNTMVFEYEEDLKEGDIVFDKHSSFVITEIKSYSGSAFPKDMWHLEAKVVSEAKYNATKLHSNNTFNMSNCSINGAVQNTGTINIGSQISLDDIKELIEKYGNEDKQQLNELLEELKSAEKFEIYKKGMLAKFGDLLAKHSWLTGALAQYIVPALFNLK